MMLEPKQSIMLHSQRLKVEIARPGEVYRGTRFDWAGFISQVTLDDKHTFCVPESYQPGEGTGGVGLCNEFGNDLAIVYDEAQPGEPFPKPGIGLLIRPDASPYNFFRPHEIAQLFPIRVEERPEEAVFITDPLDCRGYAFRLTKNIKVNDNQLEIAYKLVNTGAKPLATNEYCHNFLGINQQLLGPEYRLRLPYKIKLEPPPRDMHKLAPASLRRLLPRFILQKIVEGMLKRMQKNLAISGNELFCRDKPQGAFYCRLQGFQPSDKPQWELVYLPSGVSVSERDYFPPMRVVVWGTTHVISAEVYIAIYLEPGETKTWTRSYVFDHS